MARTGVRTDRSDELKFRIVHLYREFQDWRVIEFTWVW